MKAAAVIDRIERGDKLHMQLVEGRRIWWFEDPHENVPDPVVSEVLSADRVMLKEAGDSLFGLRMNSQTWLPDDGEVSP